MYADELWVLDILWGVDMHMRPPVSESAICHQMHQPICADASGAEPAGAADRLGQTATMRGTRGLETIFLLISG